MRIKASDVTLIDASEAFFAAVIAEVPLDSLKIRLIALVREYLFVFIWQFLGTRARDALFVDRPCANYPAVTQKLPIEKQLALLEKIVALIEKSASQIPNGCCFHRK